MRLWRQRPHWSSSRTRTFFCIKHSDHAKNFVWLVGKFWDVSQLFPLGNSGNNVTFSAMGAPRKSWGTYFHVKSKNNWGPLSSLFSILAIKMHFWPIYCYFLPPYHFKWKMAKNAFKWPKSKKFRKRTLIIFRFYMKICLPSFSGSPRGWESDIIS